MVESDCERDRAAQGVTNHKRTLEPYRVHEFDDQAPLGGQPGGRAGRARRIARAGPINRDHAELVGQQIDERMREVSHLPCQAVDQKDCRTAATIQIMDAGAVHINELSKRRYRLLDGTRDEGCEQHQARHNQPDQSEERDHRDQDRTHDRGASFISTSQYETGIRRSISAMSFASEPTSTRGFRRSIPLTIISPALAGGIVNSLFARACAAAICSGVALAGERALLAIDVATPPGCTTVTPTLLPFSSRRSASENPRTANLLAE